jgi:hypothetical protein
LIGAKFVGTELIGRLAKMLGEVAYHPEILTSGDLRVVAALEFFSIIWRKRVTRNTRFAPAHSVVETSGSTMIDATLSSARAAVSTMLACHQRFASSGVQEPISPQFLRMNLGLPRFRLGRFFQRRGVRDFFVVLRRN